MRNAGDISNPSWPTASIFCVWSVCRVHLSRTDPTGIVLVCVVLSSICAFQNMLNVDTCKMCLSEPDCDWCKILYFVRFKNSEGGCHITKCLRSALVLCSSVCLSLVRLHYFMLPLKKRDSWSWKRILVWISRTLVHFDLSSESFLWSKKP